MRSTIVSSLIWLFGMVPAFARERQIDLERSMLIVHVQKSGLLSAAGHEHTVMAPIADGSIDDGNEPRVNFRGMSSTMTDQPEEHQSQVQHTMQERVLESGRYSEIRFTSQAIKSTGDGRWIVVGDLSLHGQVRKIQVTVSRLQEIYIGEATIKQTDFGIQPVSAAGGTIKVKNELKINFTIATK